MRVKCLLMMALVVLASWGSMTAQDDWYQKTDTIRTLFDSQKINWGGYGGPECRITNINGETGLLVGGRGGLIMNKSLVIGIAGYGLVTDHRIRDYVPADSSKVYLRGGWGGLMIEYIHSSNQVVHFTLSSLVGGGAAGYSGSLYHHHNDDDDDKDWMYEEDAFFVFEPGASIEANIFKFMRLNLGVSYRMVSGLSLPNTENEDLSGLSGNLTFKFGSF
ncbi:MAG: hypothetical protein KBA26_08380 [Candidatus Delongbacteria bacterium]|nr:hypothetical protein [Candidatus Delongbacteria bacterium]